MGPSVVVRGGARGALAGTCLLHGDADSGEVGGEVLEGPRECVARVTDGEGNELHPSPIPYEGRDEWGVFLGLLVDFNVASEVRAEADLDNGENALFPVERDHVGGGSVWDPSCIDEVW